MASCCVTDKGRNASTLITVCRDRFVRSQDSSFDTETDWMSGVQFLGGTRDFSVHHSVQTGSGAHPVSYSMGTCGLFPPGEKRTGGIADH
jgi:hypothetical protein